MKRTLGRGTMITRGLEGVTLAVDAVRANKTRASLTILGVAIGVMVVIAMASMITGIQGSVSEMVQRAGPKSFYVMRYFRAGLDISDGSDEMSPWRRRPQISHEEADLISKLPSVAAINIREMSSSRVSYRDKSFDDTGVDGMTSSWLQVEGGELTDGRNFTPIEEAGSAFVVVINSVAADHLFPGLDPVGKVVRIFGLPFTVIGLYQDPAGLFADDERPKFVVPHRTFVKHALFNWGWTQVSVFPAATATQVETMDEVTVALRVDRGLKPGAENNFDLVSGAQFMERFNQMTAGFFLVMLVLSSVGLMVGGVGVVAIMMISVTERTREIGVRKALGATRRDILTQFLTEAMTLTGVGGILGILIGGGLAALVNTFSPFPAVMQTTWVTIAFVVAILTGLTFGLWPAWKAAGLDPIEALRYE